VHINAQMVDDRLLRRTAQLQQSLSKRCALNEKPVSELEQTPVPPAPSRQPRDRGGIIAVERGHQRDAQPSAQPEQVDRLRAKVRMEEGWLNSPYRPLVGAAHDLEGHCQPIEPAPTAADTGGTEQSIGRPMALREEHRIELELVFILPRLSCDDGLVAGGPNDLVVDPVLGQHHEPLGKVDDHRQFWGTRRGCDTTYHTLILPLKTVRRRIAPRHGETNPGDSARGLSAHLSFVRTDRHY